VQVVKNLHLPRFTLEKFLTDSCNSKTNTGKMSSPFEPHTSYLCKKCRVSCWHTDSGSFFKMDYDQFLMITLTDDDKSITGGLKTLRGLSPRANYTDRATAASHEVNANFCG
jgi:hypothetical protein